MRFPVCLSAVVASLSAQLAPPASAFDADRYVGHLKLEQTTLVITEAVTGLTVPWEITFGPDGWLWFTQHEGSISRYNPDTHAVERIFVVPEVYHKKSLGLLGMALHPDFTSKPYVFVHYTYREETPDRLEIIHSRLVRYTFRDGTMTDPTTLLDAIPGASYHNGSRIVATADDELFLTTGDAGSPDTTQNPDTLNGKVLHLKIDGSIPSDNPYPTSPVWSVGHRNAQGLVFAANGKLYASEHGPNNDDELNLVLPGRNYGWPNVEGFADAPAEIEYAAQNAIAEPMRAWTPTIAAAGLDFYASPKTLEWQNSLLLVSMKGRSFRVLKLDDAGETVISERIFFQKRFGRMRDLCVAPNGDVYLATSNRDWHPRYQPWMYDALPGGPDRILRLHPADADELAQIAALPSPVEIREDADAMSLMSEDWSFRATNDDITEGESLYMIHCAACHNPLGTGAPGLYPPLAGAKWVTGDKTRLIQLALKGMRGPIVRNGQTYDQEMPGFANRTDEEIADILTYIRNAWGNSANAVIPGEVFEERKAVSGAAR